MSAHSGSACTDGELSHMPNSSEVVWGGGGGGVCMHVCVHACVCVCVCVQACVCVCVCVCVIEKDTQTKGT